ALLSAGQMYILRVGAYSNTTGTGAYQVLATYSAPVTNDECGPTNPVLSLDTPATGTTIGATTSLAVSPYTLCGPFAGSGGGIDVFYRFIPASSGAYTISTCGSGFDTVISLHSDCPVSADNIVACNDDAPAGTCASGSLTSQVSVTLVGGHTYYVRIAGYGA